MIATGINVHGEVVGFYYVSTSEGQWSHGFLRRSDGSILSFDPPSSRETFAHGLNDSGAIVGAYLDSLRITRGFIRDPSGSFESIDVPEAVSTIPTAINNNGEIAGYFLARGIGDRGFIRLADQNFLVLEPDGMKPKSINDSGALVGLTKVGGFVHLPGYSLQRLEHPTCSGSCTIPTGINERGEIVGQYQLGGRVLWFHGGSSIEGWSLTRPYQAQHSTAPTPLRKTWPRIGCQRWQPSKAAHLIVIH